MPIGRAAIRISLCCATIRSSNGCIRRTRKGLGGRGRNVLAPSLRFGPAPRRRRVLIPSTFGPTADIFLFARAIALCRLPHLSVPDVHDVAVPYRVALPLESPVAGFLRPRERSSRCDEV